LLSAPFHPLQRRVVFAKITLMNTETKTNNKMDLITSLCRRRGIIFPSSDIYGGLGSCWDYGPVGVLLKNNVKAAWWRAVVQLRNDIVGLDASIIMHPQVWEASGHISNFSDPLVDCKTCKLRFRADEINNAEKCPACGGELTSPRQFNLMFKTHLGPVEEAAGVVYLRPETAQGIFVNFKNVLNVSRKKPPFGIAQIGKSFRNEITPGKFIFRTREFEQMEIEFFVPPIEADQWLEKWQQERFNWYLKLGLKPENLRLRKHEADELAHYAKGCYDVEYNFPWGFAELEGIANRGDYDLRQHQVHSGKDLGFFDEETKDTYLPYIIEPSAGVDRSLLAFLVDAYDEDNAPDDKGQMETRVILRLHRALSPYKVAIFPLFKKPELKEIAEKLYQDLRVQYMCDYDERGSIGKRYRRQDEIGTNYCVTVDYQTKEDHAVTVRDRDTMEQKRINLSQIKEYLAGLLEY